MPRAFWCLLLLCLSNVSFASASNKIPTLRQLDGMPCAADFMTKSYTAPAVKPTLAVWLAHPIQWLLAHNVPTIGRQKVTRLIQEAQILLPFEAMLQMAYLPQTSHDYLVFNLPKDPAIDASLAKLAATPKVDPIAVKITRDRLYKAHWYGRLSKAHAKLSEALHLLSRYSDGEGADVSTLHVHLGIIDSFVYGFVGEIQQATGLPWGRVGGSLGNDVVRDATLHFRAAIRSFKVRGGDHRDADALTLLNFFLGKHAANGQEYFKHANVNESFEYRAIAKNHLWQVLHDLKQDAIGVQGLSERKQLYLDAAFRLAVSEEWPVVVGQMPPVYTGREPGVHPFTSVTDIYAELIRSASKEWVERERKDYLSLLWRLNNAVRWGYQARGDDRVRDLLFSLGSEGTYDGFLRRWSEAGFSTP